MRIVIAIETGDVRAEKEEDLLKKLGDDALITVRDHGIPKATAKVYTDVPAKPKIEVLKPQGRFH